MQPAATSSCRRIAHERHSSAPPASPRASPRHGAGCVGRVRAAHHGRAAAASPRRPAKWRRSEDFDGSFIYCRGVYQSVVREAGGIGWSTDYPAADNNFSVRLMELTLTHVKLDVERQPDTVVVRLTDPLLYHCPILFMEDVGTAQLQRAGSRDPARLLPQGRLPLGRRFLGIAGVGAVGTRDRTRPAAGRVPDLRHSRDHPIMHTLYNVKEVPQVSSINFWSRNGGSTSERGSDSPHAISAASTTSTAA